MSPEPKIAVPRVIASGIDELIEAQIADPGTLPESFDAVISVHSIYFSSNAPGFLSFALDRLRPGGSCSSCSPKVWGVSPGR